MTAVTVECQCGWCWHGSQNLALKRLEEHRAKCKSTKSG